ncbi:MAG: HAMP domain-containing sensor histidine kinase [Eubacteriales bacterium]|nr:HAMP domain-containing sensor histidine kinase [Eubacteriales bacterium]
MIYWLFALVLAIALYLFYRCKRYEKWLENLEDELQFLDRYPDSHLKLLDQSKPPQVKNILEEIVKLSARSYQSALEVSKLREEQETLISGILHDFRTPLTSIQGYLDLLNQEYKKTDEQIDHAKIHQYLQIINERSQVLYEQASSFYLLSILESKHRKVEFESLSLADLLSEEIAARATELEEKFGEEIDIEIDELVPIEQSRLDLQRIISNLIRNSLAHGEAPFSVKLYEAEGTQIIEVCNRWYNPGLVDLERLLDRSFRTDPSRHNSRIPHAGLGMSIIRELCQHLNIEIHLSEDCSAANRLLAAEHQPHVAILRIQLIFKEIVKIPL